MGGRFNEILRVRAAFPLDSTTQVRVGWRKYIGTPSRMLTCSDVNKLSMTFFAPHTYVVYLDKERKSFDVGREYRENSLYFVDHCIVMQSPKRFWCSQQVVDGNMRPSVCTNCQQPCSQCSVGCLSRSKHAKTSSISRNTVAKQFISV